VPFTGSRQVSLAAMVGVTVDAWTWASSIRAPVLGLHGAAAFWGTESFGDPEGSGPGGRGILGDPVGILGEPGQKPRVFIE
jgi:hypothetical protein